MSLGFREQMPDKLGNMVDRLTGRKPIPFAPEEIRNLTALISQHPGLSENQVSLLGKWGERVAVDTSLIYPDMQGAVDFINSDPLYPELGRPLSRRLRRTASAHRRENRLLKNALDHLQGTQLVILDQNNFFNERRVPLEIQCLLGENEADFNYMAERIQGGEKFALMKAPDLTPNMYSALQDLIEVEGGRVSHIIEHIRAGEIPDPNNYFPNDREHALDLWRELIEGSQSLIQFKSLTGNSEQALGFDSRVNKAIDDKFERHYAAWRIEHHAYNRDVRMAKIALAAALGVTGVLATVGLGSTNNTLLEAAKTGLPLMVGDIVNNGLMAAPFIDEEGSTSSKMQELAHILSTRFLSPIIFGVAYGYFMGYLSDSLQGMHTQGATLMAGLVLGSGAIAPSLFTLGRVRAEYRDHSNGNNVNGHDLLSDHPVQGSLLGASLATAVVTTMLGLSDAFTGTDLLRNPLALTAATEGLEPAWLLTQSLVRLASLRGQYTEVFPPYPISEFRKAISGFSN